MLGPGAVFADRAGIAIGQVLEQRPGVTGKPVRLADPPSFLAGREDLLAELDTRLTGGDGSGPRTVALCGLEGVGKTSVALEYAHRHLAEVRVAWQLAAEDPAVLAAGFGELAAQLGARDLFDTRNPVASVHGMLATFPAEWLLIFDNVPDRASLQAFLPPAGPGRVLITSQNQDWPPGQALEVPVLGTEVTAEFLVNRTGDPDRQAALDLAGELGGLPLALEQAVGYMQATGDSLAGYLELFRQRRPDMLARGEPTGYSETVATTWALAFGRLGSAASGAVGLLRLLAFCAPEAVPLRTLLQARPGVPEQLGAEVAPVLVPLLEDPLAAKDAIAALRQYSLISPSVDGSVSVHRLVQAVTADQMSAELAGAWRQATAAVIEATIPDDIDTPATWPVCAALLPHARAALAADSDGLERLANYLGERGSYTAACDLLQRALDAEGEVLGLDHPDTLATWHNLAHWTGEAGDPAGARDQFAALLPVSERVLGADHPDTLADRYTLAYWAGKAGDPAGARDQFAALLPVRERVSGALHPSTLGARANVAHWTGKAGDPAGARDQFAALLPVDERGFGADHPDTLSDRHELASWAGAAGDPAGARDQYAALLPVREQVL
ncbi:MAG TPA: tetratricopeptide repeat protein, partial [Streptosporangiaceae bacterium]